MPENMILNLNDPRMKSRFVGWFQKLAGIYRVTVVKEQKRKRRSNAQNRYYWGVVIPSVVAGIKDCWGETWDKDRAHMYLKVKFLSSVITDQSTGELVVIPQTSHDKDTERFGQFIDDCCAFAAECLGVVVPEPAEDIWTDHVPAEKPKRQKAA